MIKCVVVESFAFGDFDKLQNIQRKSTDKKGYLYKGDIFECDKETAEYLMGENKYNRQFVDKILVPKEEKKTLEATVIEKPKKTTTRKRKTIAKE